MNLQFHPVGDGLTPVPGQPIIKGGFMRYVGRATKPTKEGKQVRYPATKEPHEVDQDSKAGRRLAKLARRGELYCANKETAAAIGARFIDIEFNGGEWSPKKAPVKPAGKE